MSIKLYTKTKSVCPQCMFIKREALNAGVEYEEICIETSAEAKQFLVDEGIMSVPVMQTEDGKLYTGATILPQMRKALASQ